MSRDSLEPTVDDRVDADSSLRPIVASTSSPTMDGFEKWGGGGKKSSLCVCLSRFDSLDSLPSLSSPSPIHTTCSTYPTALHWAAANGNVEVATMLLDAGIRADIVDRNKASALHWAAYLGSTNVCALLVQRAPHLAALCDANGRTYLDELHRYTQNDIDLDILLTNIGHLIQRDVICVVPVYVFTCLLWYATARFWSDMRWPLLFRPATQQ